MRARIKERKRGGEGDKMRGRRGVMGKRGRERGDRRRDRKERRGERKDERKR